jgi:GAF domain-containing protein
MGRCARPAKAKVEARSTPTRKSREVASATGLQYKQRLSEALEQHAAVSEILQVISASPSDVQPVLDAVAERAARLCEAPLARVSLVDRDVLHLMAEYSLDGAPQAGAVPRPLRRSSISGRAILDRSTIHHDDVVPLLDSEYPDALNARRLGIRAALAVPLMREGNAYGAIFLWRREPGLFSPEKVALVQTFAQQAAIAVDNVRLFKATKVALEQQTATSEILRVISQSLTDVKPVFDTIARAALALCRASSATLFTFDGELIRLATFANVNPEGADAVRLTFPRAPSRDTAVGRAVLTGRVVAIPDVLEDPEYAVKDSSVAAGFRSLLSVPLIRDKSPIGAISVGKPEPGLFPDEQVALLQTFADQAVIAIENVRLFDEVQARTHDLTESLQQQTATADVLKVISRSTFDLQTVLDTLTESACKLCEAENSVIWRSVGDGIKAAAMFGVSPAHKAAVERLVIGPGRETCAGRALLEGSTVHIPDAESDPEYNFANFLSAAGNRAMLGVPLLREGAPIGVIGLTRSVASPFTEKQIALATTFADQAVIAIENVRLFNETKEALEQQTAISEILRVISNSPTDVQPMLNAVVERAAKLCEAANASIFLVEGGNYRSAARFGNAKRALELGEYIPLTRGSAAGRAIIDRTTIHLEDVAVAPEEEYPMTRHWQRIIGHHTLLAVPLMREHRAIGAIALWRMETRPFTEKQINLVKTFADQAAIAIENVRLFTELEARTRELTRSVQELKALGEVGQAVSSTLDLETVLSTIVARATSLAGVDGGSIWEYDEAREEFYVHATDRLPNELVEAQRAAPIRKGEGALGRLAVTAEPVVIRDIVEEESYQSHLREVLIRCGYRSLLAVPLLRQDHLLGALAVSRNRPSDFSPEVIALLRTFATQSALAIQNARLYREIEVKSHELEAASRHKSEFLANMSHELRTPLNAIIGFSEVLSERMFGEINEKQAEYIGDILQSGQHLLSLINDILDLSKIEAGRMELELSDFDLPSTIENTLTLVRERAVRRGIALERTVDERLGTIRADERKVKQVLLNLLSNALKFTPEGGKIAVQAALNDGVAEISVTDTGVGIAPEDQAAVFEEFRQVGTAAKKIEGTGLGLAISRKFIELHGGRIWVKSIVGSGSTFAFTLPLP